MQAKDAIRSQDHATLNMPREAVERRPSSVWADSGYQNPSTPGMTPMTIQRLPA